MNNIQIAAALRQIAAALDVEAPAAPASAPALCATCTDLWGKPSQAGLWPCRHTGEALERSNVNWAEPKEAPAKKARAAKAPAKKAAPAPAPKVRFLTSKSLPDFKREFPQAAGLSTRQVVEIVLDNERETGEMPAGWEVGPKYRAMYAEAQAGLAAGKHVA